MRGTALSPPAGCPEADATGSEALADRGQQVTALAVDRADAAEHLIVTGHIGQPGVLRRPLGHETGLSERQ